MKNFRSIIVGFIVGVLITVPVTALGASNAKIEALLFPDIKVVVDGEQIHLENPPIAVDGRTYLSLRDLAEKVLDMDVSWEQETTTAILSSKAETSIPDAELTEDQLSKRESFRRAMAERRHEYFDYDAELDVEKIKSLINRIESEIRLEQKFLEDAEKSNDPERFPPYLNDIVVEGLEQLFQARDYWQSRVDELETQQVEQTE